jgi:chromate transport protein ChrA
MTTPALLIIPLVHFAGRKAEHPRVKAILRAVVLASAGLLLAASLPLARAAVTGPVMLVITLATSGLMLKTKIDTLWIILGAGVVAMAASALMVVTVDVFVAREVDALVSKGWEVKSTRLLPGRRDTPYSRTYGDSWVLSSTASLKPG